MAAVAVASIGTGIAVVGLSSPASAHCLNNSGSYTASSSAYGKELNLNGNTCNGDTEYTGRFQDLYVDGVRVRMRWKLTAAGSFSYSSISDGTGINYLWYYDDTDQTAYFNICHTDTAGNLLSCASQGTDVGH